MDELRNEKMLRQASQFCRSTYTFHLYDGVTEMCSGEDSGLERGILTFSWAWDAEMIVLF